MDHLQSAVKGKNEDTLFLYLGSFIMLMVFEMFWYLFYFLAGTSLPPRPVLYSEDDVKSHSLTFFVLVWTEKLQVKIHLRGSMSDTPEPVCQAWTATPAFITFYTEMNLFQQNRCDQF